MQDHFTALGPGHLVIINANINSDFLETENKQLEYFKVHHFCWRVTFFPISAGSHLICELRILFGWNYYVTHDVDIDVF